MSTDEWTTVKKAEKKKIQKFEDQIAFLLHDNVLVQISITQVKPEPTLSKEMKELYKKYFLPGLETDDQKNYGNRIVTDSKFNELSWVAHHGKKLVGIITLAIDTAGEVQIKNFSYDNNYGHPLLKNKLLELVTKYADFQKLKKLTLVINETKQKEIPLLKFQGWVVEGCGQDEYAAKIGMRKIYLNKTL